MALYNFFPIFTLHEIFVFSGWSIFVTACSIILRYASGLQIPLLIVATLLWIISASLKFLASFAEVCVVIQKMGLFEAAGRSMKLTASYLGHVVFLTILMLIIGLRILINALAVVLLPLILLGLGILLTWFV